MNDRRIQRKLLQFLFVIVIFVNFYIFLLNNFASEIQSAINSSATIAEIVVGRIEDGKIDGKIDWHDYKFMLSETDRVGPGEKGLPHVLTDPADIEINKAAHNELGFAVLISDLISPNRSLPDVRLDSCKTKKHLKNLPSASIVVIFYNEQISCLLRCLHSIYNRTPPKLLHEIILVNDNSTDADLYEPIESYVVENFDGKVKIFVNQGRKGLIVTRMEGAKRATGDVIVFLDSHMEVNVNWLPPLLEPIALNSKTATVPILDSFSPFTLEYERLGHGTRGGFDWGMVYKWFPMRPIDLETPDQPFPLPAMTGGAYAIRRDYFFELGGYDDGLYIWNGENYEMSFKLWLCGGQLLEVPCSHVAHTSKLKSNYRNDNYGFDYSTRNLKRVAEVWMDEYKKYVFATDPRKFSIDTGDLSKALALKEKLNCKPFKYYLEEIAPEILHRYTPPDWGIFASGAIISEAEPTLCVTNQRYEDPLFLSECALNKTQPYFSQDFVFTYNRFIKYNDASWKCIDAPNMNLLDCHFTFGHQLWFYDLKSHQLKNIPHDTCASCDTLLKKISLMPCNVTDVNQKFNWGYLNTTAFENWETYGIKLPKL